MRVGLDVDAEALLAGVFRQHLIAWAETGATTARQGSAIEVSWVVTLRVSHGPAQLVRAINGVEGVQSVELSQRDNGG